MEDDIIYLDSQIQLHFKNEVKNIKLYYSKIEDIKRILNQEELDDNVRANLLENIKNLEKNIQDIQSEQNYNFYITESLPIIEEYKKLLRTPLKMSFLGTCNNNDVEKQRLISEFMQLAKKYMTFTNTSAAPSTPLAPSKKPRIICDNCRSKNIILSENIIFICIDCGFEKEVYANTMSYKDISRTNILQKYTYERRSHFRDCINQFQGKQNCKIEKICEDLEKEFEKHHLLIGTSENTPRQERFKNIGKEHIMLFLKELHYDKQYENVNLIHSQITGKKCEDISHIEDQLMADFDVLVSLYIKKFKYEKKIDRKSFMNIQYVFFQLLNKNKYPCRKEDFNILKTIDRKAFHDDVFKELFEELGWNHTPFF